MKKNPLISVVLPVYNAEFFVERAINSILNQTYSNFELIIINDGSTDCTWDKVKLFNDNRIKAIDMPFNQGLIHVLNHGFDVSVGDYIARMDADDIALPEKLYKQLMFLEENKDYVACGTSIINFNDSSESYLQYPENNKEILTSLAFFERNICHPTVMIRGGIIREHNLKYRADYLHAEDYTLWIDLSEHGRLHNLKDGLLKYYRHDGQVSVKHYKVQMETSRRIVKELLSTRFGESIDLDDLEKCTEFLVHEAGESNKYIDENELNLIYHKLLCLAESDPYFCKVYSKRILTFKCFRAAFHYDFSFVKKVRMLFNLVLVHPKQGLNNLTTLVKLFMLYRFKKIKQ